MALSYKTRRRLSLLILLVGLPVYIIVAATLTSILRANGFLSGPMMILEFVIYVVLGIVWALPFKSIFMGVGQADPDAPTFDDDPK